MFTTLYSDWLKITCKLHKKTCLTLIDIFRLKIIKTIMYYASVSTNPIISNNFITLAGINRDAVIGHKTIERKL